MVRQPIRYLFRLVLLLTATVWLPAAPAEASAADAALPDGHFYTQAGGENGMGFPIVDGKNGRFWTSFQALGGVVALGYPASLPYQADGFTYQAVQGALLQWRPELGRAILANTFEQFTAAGIDQVLYQERQIPVPISDDGSGGDYNRAVSIRLSWLTDQGIAQRFAANPNPAVFPTWSVADAIQLYGLPMSQPEAFGPFISQRFQRITFQRWVQPVPGMPPPGTIVRVLGGDLAKEEGLVPTEAQAPRSMAQAEDLVSSTDVSTLTSQDLQSPVGEATSPAAAQPPTGPNQFPLAACRASAVDPKANQEVAAHAAPEAGTYLLYGATVVKVEHNDNCWSPSQVQQMGNHRDVREITEAVIHWTDLDYSRSAYVLRRGVSVHWLVPQSKDAAQPALEMVDPRNAAWHAGPLNKGLWEDAAHMLCYPGDPCRPNGNVHSLGFENVGKTVPNDYQVGVMADILATLIREGYPIKLDRQHIVGHREINSHKPDPGNLDISHLIDLVEQRLTGPAAAPPKLTAPPPTASPPTADGSSSLPLPLVGTASGQLIGNSGGVQRYYVITAPSGAPLTLHFSYTGISAPAGAAGVNVYQGSTQLGSLSPSGNQPGGAAGTFNPMGGVPVILQVFSYLPQPVQYQLSLGS